MATAGKVTLQPNSTGTSVDGVMLDAGVGTALRQAIAVGDATSGSAYAVVGAAVPASTDNALYVRAVGLPAALAAADAMANMSATQLLAAGLMWNGTSWDRVRGNTNVAMGDIGARSGANVGGATQTNHNARGAKIFVVASSVTGTFSAQFQISPDSGTTWISAGSAQSLTAAGSLMFSIYPTSESVVGSIFTLLSLNVTNSVAFNAPLPRTWRLLYSGTATLTVTHAAYLQ